MINLIDYLRDERQFMQECYDVALLREPTMERNEFMQRYALSPYPEQYRQYWLGERHKPRVESVVNHLLDNLELIVTAEITEGFLHHK